MSDSPHRLSQMPQSPDDQRILRERAEALRQGDGDGPSAEGTAYIALGLGPSECYGVPHRFVEEVFAAGEIVPVPGVPPQVAGVVNRRGDLLTAIDLKQFFRTGGQRDSGQATVVIVSVGGLTVALLADRIEGEDRFDEDDLAAPLPSDGIASLEHVLGIHGGKIVIIDIERLMQDVGGAIKAFRPSSGEQTP